MAAGRVRQSADFWHSLFRIGVGAYWLYFAAQKWPAPIGIAPGPGISWMHDYIQRSAQANPIPQLHDFLASVVLPHWQYFATAQAVGETVVGVLLILGLATRPAGLIGTLLGLNLSLTVAFLVGDIGLRWLYYLGALASFEVFVTGAGSLALDRARVVPQWLRS